MHITSECKALWGEPEELFNMRTHVRNHSRRACLSSACSAASLSNCLVRKRLYNTCRANENRLWNASLRDNLSYIYMFELHKPVKERFSEGSEAVVLLNVVLSGLPVGIV